MAETPRSVLVWDDGCPDCGHREVRLPLPPVPVADDFDWSGRDFEHFRRVMLGARRRRPRAYALDQERPRGGPRRSAGGGVRRTSHAIDVAFHQRFLGTAEWPFAIVRLLAQIDGVDAAAEAIERRLSQREAVQLRLRRPGDPPPRRADGGADGAFRANRPRQGGRPERRRHDAGAVRPDNLVDALRTCPVVSEASAVATLQKGRQTYLVSVLLDPPSLRLHDRAGEVDEPTSRVPVLVRRPRRPRRPPGAA